MRQNHSLTSPTYPHNESAANQKQDTCTQPKVLQARKVDGRRGGGRKQADMEAGPQRQRYSKHKRSTAEGGEGDKHEWRGVGKGGGNSHSGGATAPKVFQAQEG